MNPEGWARLAAEFDAICDRPPAERAAALERLEAEDAGLARELARMLAADGEESRVLGRGAHAFALEEMPGTTAPTEPAVAGIDRGLAAGDRLGSWRLVARLGAGGMGEVWDAERADGTFEQRVAVKLLKRGLETDALLSRFALERRILARLTHPGIARLLDAGSTDDGRPYFVLERVEGRPITRWAKERKLPVVARLRLMLQVADAVDFAHRNLVVHRDLKPSNVLVSDAGEVKLLDFGVAKLLESEGDGARTELEARALTPQYAAPEQLRGDPVTTATDVYALGVMLYELLTGRMPHRRKRSSLADLAAQVEHETVERPSTAVRHGESEEDPPGDPERVSRALAGDLDTLLMKALAREPERRYPTAAALAEDIRRHLDGRPISARPDTVRYRLDKLVRRHRIAFGAAAAVLVALVAGLAAALWQAERATREARRAGRVRDFLVSIFESRDPDRGAARGQTVEQLVDTSVVRLSSELGGEPEVEADLAEALARAELSLGRFDNAERLANRAIELRLPRFGEESAEAAECWTTLGAIARARGSADARERLERALAIATAATGADGVEASRARIELAALATTEARFADAIALSARAHEALLTKLGPDHRSTLAALQARSQAAIHGGDRLEAERVLRAALSESSGAPDSLPLTRAILRRDLAHLLILQRRSPEALEESAQALQELERLLPGDHIEVANAQRVRAMALSQSGDFNASLELTQRALEMLERAAPNHELRASLVSELGIAHLHLGHLEEALAYFREDLAGVERIFGPGSMRAMEARSVVANALHEAGRDAEALAETTWMVARLRSDPLLGATLLPGAILALHSELLRSAGRHAEAIEASRFSLECLRRRGELVDPSLEMEAELDLAVNLIASGTAEGLREARKIAEAALVPIPGSSLGAHLALPDRLLGQIESAEGRHDEARKRFERALAAEATSGRDTSIEAAETRLELGLSLEQLGELEEARRELVEAESQLFRRKGRDAAETARARAARSRVEARLR